jgi:hypothetical protein
VTFLRLLEIKAECDCKEDLKHDVGISEASLGAEAAYALGVFTRMGEVAAPRHFVAGQ